MGKTVSEKQVERALVKRVKELGGTCEKFGGPGNRGKPDRIAILPASTGPHVVGRDGRPKHGPFICFVELKAPGKRPTPLQHKDHQRRANMGCRVAVIDTIGKAQSFPYVSIVKPECYAKPE